MIDVGENPLPNVNSIQGITNFRLKIKYYLFNNNK